MIQVILKIWIINKTEPCKGRKQTPYSKEPFFCVTWMSNVYQVVSSSTFNYCYKFGSSSSEDYSNLKCFFQESKSLDKTNKYLNFLLAFKWNHFYRNDSCNYRSANFSSRLKNPERADNASHFKSCMLILRLLSRRTKCRRVLHILLKS